MKNLKYFLVLIISFNGIAQNQKKETVTITKSIDDTKESETANTIVASAKISNQSDVNLIARNSIVLIDGFSVEEGAKFYGHIIVENLNNAIEDTTNNSSFKLLIYPNPTTSLVNISTKEFLIKKIVVSKINDSGIVFMKPVDNQTEISIDITSFEKGIYIVSIETADGKVTNEKLIKN